ncbi:hypothetical protein ACK8GG_20660 [Micromonosporaceae bacterium DT55]|uniref:hypothetical protein n=1 Tax=Melissospora conviva TaxID=3388432 RepID=UPI003C1C0949
MENHEGSLEANLEYLRSSRADFGWDRRRVLWRLTDHGMELVPRLRQIRREGPGRLRAAALEVLVAIGGEAVLDEADMAAAERLIRVKAPSETPIGIDACVTFWICVRGGDQQGVMSSLGLTALRPATFALGESVVVGDAHGDESGLVFVTPELNGWTAVVGLWCDPFVDERREEIRALVEELSERYDEAHAYYFSSQGDGSAWLIARNGRTVRRYIEWSAAMALGEPLPIERQYLDQLGIRGNPEDHHESDDDLLGDFHLECDATTVAAAMSIDVVSSMSTEWVVRGTGQLALVPGASTTGIPPGPHRI